MSKNYMILEGIGAMDIEGQVNEMLDKGYRLAGGTYIPDDSVNGYYRQAVVKYVKESKPTINTMRFDTKEYRTFFLLSHETNTMHQYKLAVPWLLDPTMQIKYSLKLRPDHEIITHLYWSSDETKLYIMADDKPYSWELVTPNDLQTAIEIGVTNNEN